MPRTSSPRLAAVLCLALLPALLALAQPAPTPPAAPPPTPAPERAPPPPLVVPRVSDAQLLALWSRWQQAHAAGNASEAQAALAQLRELRDEAQAADLEPLSVGLLRAARAKREAGDAGAAVALTEAAVTLSPHLPYARLEYAEALARRDPAAVGGYLGEARQALAALVEDPRYLRPALADVGAMALFALLATAVAVVGVLFLRRARYLLHDFHHLFPRAMDPWQSGLLALLLLSAPLVLRLGLVAVLLALLAAVAVYLSVAERAVAWALVALVGLAPLLAGGLARRTAFAGTVAEDVYLLDRGGLAASEAAARVLARHAARGASFEELCALGHYETRRGLLPQAVAHYKAANTLQGGDVRLLTHLGNALLASGDLDGAIQLYTDATRVDPTQPAAFYNLAMALRRRARMVPDELVSGVLHEAREAMSAAQALEPSLLQREPPADDRLVVGRLVLSLPLPDSALGVPEAQLGTGAQVQAQLSRVLMGGLTGPLAWGLPLLAGGLLFGWGFLRPQLKASRVCDKCGRPVCRRCDPELGVGSLMCTQCVNVFARKGLVPAPMRARKQEQVARHQAWMGRLALGLGALLSGAGHVFAGLPLRGALYTFLFLLGVGAVLFHGGVLRAPYGQLPVPLKLTLAALLLLPVYLGTLRGLYKRQNG